MKSVSYLRNSELNELQYIVLIHIGRFLVSFISHIWSLNQQTEPTLPTQIHYNLPPNVVQSLKNFDVYWEFTIMHNMNVNKQINGSQVCLPVTKFNVFLELDHTQSVHSENSEINTRTIRTLGKRTKSDKPPYLCLVVTVRLMLSSASSRQTMIPRYTLTNVTAVLSAVCGNCSWG